jgi:hypothetical protein
MVRQRDKPGTGWRQAYTKAGREANALGKRQALRQMVRQRDKPGTGWRQACTKAGRKAKH